MEILAWPPAAAERADSEGLRPRVLIAIALLAVVRGEVVVALRAADTSVSASWALPRRLLRPGESLEAAAREELRRVAAGTPCHLEQLFTRGGGHPEAGDGVLEVAYLALAGPDVVRNGAECRWCAVKELSALEEGHRDVAEAALERLRRQLGHTDLAWSLLPAEFTLSELQGVFEAVGQRELDKRNFRKWVLANERVEATFRERRDGAHRPARLYRFRGSATAPPDSAER